MSHAPELSIVIPVYNEQEVLPALFERLYAVVDMLSLPCEVIFVDDCSRDASPRLLREQFQRRPDITRVLLLASNCGQHNAIRAGFHRCRGRWVITLDADLQNLPEDIPLLLEKFNQGHDYVGGVRQARQDRYWRRWSSSILNRMRERMTNIHMTDQGCMLRGYSRQVVDAINDCQEVNTFIPALAYIFARNPVEIEVSHAARQGGHSKYSLFSLIRLYFDLMTGFSVVPLRIVSACGIILALCGLLLYMAVIVVRVVNLGWYAGLRLLWDRDIIEYFLIGILLLIQGILGEYTVRIYQQVIRRPLYLVGTMLEKKSAEQ